MPSKLPINLADLLRQRTVERDRIEYKAGWNPDAILRTLCAFANDFENLGGGYVVIGQDCDKDGQPIFPPVGLKANQLDKIQRELLGYCHLIQPPYFPILSVEEYEGRNLLVLWCPGGLTRPYEVPRAVTAKVKEYHYYIRRYSSTVEAKGEDRQELLRLTATVPFDDRPCRQADVDDLRPALIQSYLKEVGSDLYKSARNTPLVELAQQLNIVVGADERMKPRNVGLLFFHDEPQQFLPGTQIDVVIFPTGPGGDELIEKTFHGPIHEQIRDALRYLQNHVLREKIVKHADRPEATRFFNYAMPAIKEALVNAMYHRGYDQPEPVEVRVDPEGIAIVSYPGPDASIRIEALNGDKIMARRYRNRRIGEFLKELDLTEGRCTGIPKIREATERNGSPPPKFSTDDGRTHFLVQFPVHPELADVQVHDEAHDGVHDEVHDEVHDGGHDAELNETERRLLTALANGPLSRPEMAEVLGMKSRRSGHLTKAVDRLRTLKLAELTIPEKPQSKNQKMRITTKGQTWLTEREQRNV
jgi:ATP-dependent DNA helicase RecG